MTTLTKTLEPVRGYQGKETGRQTAVIKDEAGREGGRCEPEHGDRFAAYGELLEALKELLPYARNGEKQEEGVRTGVLLSIIAKAERAVAKAEEGRNQ